MIHLDATLPSGSISPISSAQLMRDLLKISQNARLYHLDGMKRVLRWAKKRYFLRVVVFVAFLLVALQIWLVNFFDTVESLPSTLDTEGLPLSLV